MKRKCSDPGDNHPALTTASPFSIGECVLSLPADLSFERWEHIGQQLHGMTRHVQWWWGDWLNFGEQKYGGKYTAAVEKFGLNLKTAQQYAWIARVFEPSLRRELSWSHHKEVAAIADPEERHGLLNSAIEKKWSKARLRQEINAPPKDRGQAPDDEQYELSELVAELRTSCATFTKRFGPDRLDTFVAVLQDVADSARELSTSSSTDQQSSDDAEVDS